MIQVAAPAPIPRVVYAGIWRRLAAFVIDSFILGLIFLAIASFYPNKLMVMPDMSAQPTFAMPVFKMPGFIVLFALMWLYYALSESSAWQGTPGKRILRIYVTDLGGRRLTFWRATLRYLGRKVADFTLFIGYILIAFTPKQQGLHDLLAGTLVLRRPR